MCPRHVKLMYAVCIEFKWNPLRTIFGIMLRVSHFTNGVAPPAGKYRSPPACKVGDLFSVWPSSASRRGCSAAGRPVRNSVCEADEVVVAAVAAGDAAVDGDDDDGGDAVDCAGPPLSISNKHEIVNSSEYSDLSLLSQFQ